MGKMRTWFGGLSNVGKVAAVSTALLVSMGTIGAMAEQGTPSPVAPVTTYQEIQETKAVPFEKVNQDDASRDAGTSVVTTPGQNGVMTKTFRVTLVDGRETERAEIKAEVTTPSVNGVTSIGTKKLYVAPPAPKVSPNCDPNYSGCVPIASDVDCVGGSGNGPAYTGMVRVIGSDIYDLDRDGNGWACE